ncbi:MAG: sigma-70 family RNA polymerase sigma factor [Cytophagaceae bacterium]|nr:sigma-70 family RNA polymerase sigma factor [Gemmatimonadaceae bacterium]
MDEPGEVTRLLSAIADGDRDAWDALFPLVYERLRAIAHRQLRGEREGHSFATTDLVHEAYFGLVGIERVMWLDRAHFLAIAARAMRRVLIDHARARATQKRGGQPGQALVDLDALSTHGSDDQVIALEEALRALETRNERYGRIVECRFFAGMSVEETAAALGISAATVKRDWSVARAWLHRELRDDDQPR